MSSRYKKIFLVRFISYVFILSGLLTLILTIEPVAAEEIKYGFNQLRDRHFVLPKVISSDEDKVGLAIKQARSARQSQELSPKTKGSSSFGSLLGGGDQIITPVSTDFGIVIEKINANAKVIPNVDPSSEKEYTSALSQGVAQAKGTVFPGQKGNIYLFSHSTDAPWNIVRYNAIFFLLGKLEVGERIIMFYQGRRYDYIVFDKVIAKANETHFLTDTYNQSVLTLQTCDPPGTLTNRLIVRARLEGVE